MNHLLSIPFIEVQFKNEMVEFTHSAKKAVKAVRSSIDGDKLFKGDAKQVDKYLQRESEKDITIFKVENGRKYPISIDELRRMENLQKQANVQKQMQDFFSLLYGLYGRAPKKQTATG